MAQEVTNFARFYALFNKLPFNGDREEFKKSIVLQYTWNRTDSLREMTRLEYKTCCEGLEKLAGVDERRQKMQEELKYWRSVCLRLMQKMGIDTSDWARVNDFCRNPRIAGKAFSQISSDELEQLAVKLRSIRRKGGLKEKKKEEVKQPAAVTYMLIATKAPKNCRRWIRDLMNCLRMSRTRYLTCSRKWTGMIGKSFSTG